MATDWMKQRRSMAATSRALLGAPDSIAGMRAARHHRASGARSSESNRAAEADLTDVTGPMGNPGIQEP